MQTLLAWILVGLIIVAAYPWAAWLLNHSNREGGLVLTLLVTLALSTGVLTLIMFWEAWAGLPLTLWGITLPYLLLALTGLILWQRRKTPPALENMNYPRAAPPKFVLAVLIIISLAVLFNAAYWPFYREDALGIYARYGKLMFESRALVPFAGRDDAFYQAYPMLVPLTYTYTYLASGWVNEYLARVIPALLSLACLPAVYVLGRLIYSSLAGWLSALLLGLTPAFARWASSGYVDLPMAFFYTLAAIFAFRLWHSRQPVDALLTGVLIGFAAWAKNAALFSIPLFGLWLVYAWLTQKISLKLILIVFVAGGLTVAPWYARNWIEAHLMVPPTAWTEQAEPSLTNLLIFFTLPDNFALSGWVIFVGWAVAGLSVWQRKKQEPGTILLLTLTTPFFLVWWFMVSYDPRFILLFLPLTAVLGGSWLAHVWEKISPHWRKRLFAPLLLLVLSLTLQIVWISVEYKEQILHNPWMGDATKHEVVLRDR